MDLELTDQNYCATIVRIPALIPLDNCDNLVGIPLFGLQAIVDKSHRVGELGVLIPTEAQLSDAMASANNLYRHEEKNIDPGAAGYLEDNRRVRAIKLRGNVSNALFLPLQSLQWTRPTAAPTLFTEGMQFNCIDGFPICEKYIRRVREGRAFNTQPKREARVDARQFPQMFDQTHWLRNDRNVPDDATLIVTQKIHGTSVRVGNVPVKRKLTWIEKLARRFGVAVSETEYAWVYGSRKVIKDASNPDQQHFYDSDLWTFEGSKIAYGIPENWIVYAEIVGWTESGQAIQKHYTYDCPPGTAKLYVYRITVVNGDGVTVDLSWDAVKEFCQSTGISHVVELWRGRRGDFVPTDWVDQNFRDNGFGSIPLSPDSPCDEGVCIRIEGLTPQIYKHKSPIFLGHETEMLDKEVIDIEAEEVEAEREVDYV